MSNDCSTEKTLLQDVKFCQGKKSLPGTKKRAYIADMRDIVSFPQKPNRDAAGFTMDKVPVLVGNFVLAQSKFFAAVDIINNNGKITVEGQGTYGSKTFKCTYTGNAPGTEEEITGLIAELLNAEIVSVVPTRSGKFRVIGSEDFPAEANLSQDTGQSPTDTNQTALEIVADDELPAPFFVGTLPLSDGILDCATGIVTSATDLTALSASPASCSIAKNATQQITLTATPSTHNETITWSSSNTTIATVDATGKITGKAAGTTTIIGQSDRTHKVVSVAVTVTGE